MTEIGDGMREHDTQARASAPELSRAELDLMRILWSADRLSAREIHGRLDPVYGWAFSTTRTMLDRMVAKGHLVREPFHGVNLYRAALSRPQGLAPLVRHFADRVLGADHSAVVGLFASASDLTPAEVEELARLVAGAREEEP